MNVEELLDQVDKMPAFPKSVQQIIELTSDLKSSGAQIVAVIESDPVMMFKILKVINSPFYGLPNKINSIQRAVVYLGLNTIKNLALSIATIGVLNPHNKAGLNTHDFLVHSLTTAAICKKLATNLAIPLAESSDYFLAGLLHDFGKIVFAEFQADNFQKALQKSAEHQLPLHQCETEFIGMDHSQIGALLATRWSFDPLLTDVIRRHHALNPRSPLGQCLFAANQISKKMHFGDSGNPVTEELPDVVAELFGKNLTELTESLDDLAALKADTLAYIS